MNEAIWQDIEWGSYDADMDLWHELARGRHSVLDLGCGAGRVAVPLAAEGYAVTGVDSQEALLDEMRFRAAGRGLDVTAIAADIRDFDLGQRFDLVLAPMQLLHLLHGAGERTAALARVREHMLPGSVFATALLDIAGEP